MARSSPSPSLRSCVRLLVAGILRTCHRPPSRPRRRPCTSPVDGCRPRPVSRSRRSTRPTARTSARSPCGDRADAGRAVEAAYAAAAPAGPPPRPSSAPPPSPAWATAIVERRDDLARALTEDQGKPLRAEAYDEVDELVAYWRMAAADATRLEGLMPPSVDPAQAHPRPARAARRGRHHHALELALHDGRRAPRAGPRRRQHRRVEPGPPHVAVLRPARRVHRRRRPPAGRLQPRHRPRRDGRRRDRRPCPDRGGRLRRLDADRARHRASRGGQGAAARARRQRAAGRHGRRRPRGGRGGHHRRPATSTPARAARPASASSSTIASTTASWPACRTPWPRHVRMGDPLDAHDHDGPAQQRGRRGQDGPPRGRGGGEPAPRSSPGASPRRPPAARSSSGRRSWTGSRRAWPSPARRRSGRSPRSPRSRTSTRRSAS